MTVAQMIARWLHEKGIAHGFGIIGGGNVAIWEAIRALGATQLISCHHEQAAAQAACYYYRTCARMPVCLVTTGAGSTNAITGVMAAWMDSIPLFVISGNEPARLWESSDSRVLGTQGYRSAEFIAPAVKYSGTLSDKMEVAGYLDTVHDIALTGRPGPVWVDICKDVQCAG